MTSRRSAQPAQNRDPLLDEDEAAEFLGLSPRTMQGMRVSGNGPDYVKLGSRAVRYRLSDLEEYIEDRIQSSTSEDDLEDE
jgi:predicted DNA-binding transcriptional regulator AlpA